MRGGTEFGDQNFQSVAELKISMMPVSPFQELESKCEPDSVQGEEPEHGIGSINMQEDLTDPLEMENRIVRTSMQENLAHPFKTELEAVVKKEYQVDPLEIEHGVEQEAFLSLEMLDTGNAAEDPLSRYRMVS